MTGKEVSMHPLTLNVGNSTAIAAVEVFMNQQEMWDTVETPTHEMTPRDWEDSDWFREWLHCHATDVEEPTAE